jgi:hypothetical protein
VGSCHDKKLDRVGNRASTQLVGSCHDKKSERDGNGASTQLVGSCHDKISEQAGCIVSTQHDSIFQLIVGFKADSDFSDIRSQIFVHFEADSNFSRYLSATLQQLNKMCSAFQMMAAEHKPIHKSNSSTFRFIVGFKQQHKLISASRHQQLIVVYVKTNSKNIPSLLQRLQNTLSGSKG